MVTERLVLVPISFRLLLLPLMLLQFPRHLLSASTPAQNSSRALQHSPSAAELLQPLLLPLLQTPNLVPLHFPLEPELFNPHLLPLLQRLNRVLPRSPLALERLSPTFPQTLDILGKSLRDTSTLQLSRSSLETRRPCHLRASVSPPTAPHSSPMRQSSCLTAPMLAPLRKIRSSARSQFQKSSSLPRSLQLFRSWCLSKCRATQNLALMWTMWMAAPCVRMNARRGSVPLVETTVTRCPNSPSPLPCLFFQHSPRSYTPWQQHRTRLPKGRRRNRPSWKSRARRPRLLMRLPLRTSKVSSPLLRMLHPLRSSSLPTNAATRSLTALCPRWPLLSCFTARRLHGKRSARLSSHLPSLPTFHRRLSANWRKARSWKTSLNPMLQGPHLVL